MSVDHQPGIQFVPASLFDLQVIDSIKILSKLHGLFNCSE